MSEATAPTIAPSSPEEALALLTKLGAPGRLVRHHELVLEAAQELAAGLESFAAHFDANEFQIGAALHDAGKILHLNEMSGPGARHEQDGRALLEDQGLAKLARFCVTHAAWREADLTLEDLLVALADKLWKGKRVEELERKVVELLARVSGREFWPVFIEVDDLFERVAAGGPWRLEMSR